MIDYVPKKVDYLHKTLKKQKSYGKNDQKIHNNIEENVTRFVDYEKHEHNLLKIIDYVHTFRL